MLFRLLLLLLLQVKKMKEAGYVLGNLDATIIAQKPKLSPHKVSTRYCSRGACSCQQIFQPHVCIALSWEVEKQP
jgi:2C-methyl-D-erythritol 2,4-cyclodiphosphate synthase